MSNKYYEENWKTTQLLLDSNIQNEPSQVDRREQRALIASLYLKYISIANRMTEIIDQIVQIQRRKLMKKLLEAVLGRILELKYDLVEADLNEWTHCGDVMEFLNLNPIDCELNVPSYFREESEDFERKLKLLRTCEINSGTASKLEEKHEPMTEAQAILCVQTHERARQGRLRAQYMKQMRQMKETSKQPILSHSDSADFVSTRMFAAIRIQRHWRGFLARRAMRKSKIQEMVLLGMIPSVRYTDEEIEEDMINKERRRKLRKNYQEDYNETLSNIRNKLEKEQKAVILEQLSEQMRGWIHEYNQHTGRIPEITGSERTTSRLQMSRQGTDSEISKSSQQNSGESKSKREGSIKSKSSPNEPEETNILQSKMLTSIFLPELNDRREEYNDVWKDMEDSEDFHQRFNRDFIVHEEVTNLENRLRRVVDEIMKSELQLLQDALDRDKGFKMKKRSSKKVKRSGKKSKKKKEKDLTPDRTEESLFEELVTNGIIRSYPEVHMREFHGERSCNIPVPFSSPKEPSNSLGDIRQLLKEYCIIPSLSQHLHQTTPHVKSVLLVGPKGSGKNMLVNSICTESGATLFDISPPNIVGKYPGKSGLIMLVHLVLKVARLFQPSVIYMNDAEKPFVKRIPRTDKTDPKRLKKDLPKIVKYLAPEDRILLIGVSRSPWDCDQRLLQSVYQKFIVVPRLDYCSRYAIWSSILKSYPLVGFDISLVTRISDGYTAGAIISTIHEVLTVKRTLQLLVHPLHPLELISVLCMKNPVYKEEEEMIAVWSQKIPMSKRRSKVIEFLKQESLEMQAKKTGSKKKASSTKSK